ncbi:MAG TPA: metal-sensing transcriptional repressor [Acholeplasmataceae bacterium]|nr:metal-sensing transcriptional repressor [Acholeplasmataceae bacterium]
MIILIITGSGEKRLNSLFLFCLTLYPIGYIILYITKRGERVENKRTHRHDNEKKKIINRINRIEGQLRGIKNMVEKDSYCDDILIQISAVANSVKSLGRLILNNHMKSCVKDELIKGNDEIIDEVINSFSRLY